MSMFKTSYNQKPMNTKIKKTHIHKEYFSIVYTQLNTWRNTITSKNLHTNYPNIIVHTSGKFEVEYLTGRKNGFAQIFSWPRYLNPLFFNMLKWHLPSLPHIYSSVFKYLRYICKEQNCVNSFFRPVTEIMERLTGMNISCLKKNN